MTIRYFPELVQGSEEWLAARCGLLTASEMKLIISPPPEPETRIKKNGEPYKQREWDPAADNDKCRAHLYELLAQRITGYVEPLYISDDMLRGINDEFEARALYAEHIAPVQEVGFITNDRFGFTIGCSPDGIVGDDGIIECKSRRQKFQVETIVRGTMPDDYLIQVQTLLLVTERKWLDFISYSGGLPMVTIRVWQDREIQDAIVLAATKFEERLRAKLDVFTDMLANKEAMLIPTKRRAESEMHL